MQKTEFVKRGLVAYFFCSIVNTAVAVDYDGGLDSLEAAQDNFDCLIEPHAVIEVSTREIGIVDQMLVSRGDIVKKGQKLVKLDSDAEALAVKLATERAKHNAKIESKNTSLEYFKRQQNRINDLYAKKVVSNNDKDKSDTDVLLAQIELQDEKETQRLAQIEKERAEQFLKQRTIFSPVKGIVVKTLLSPGEYVENRPILTLAEVDPLNVEVILPITMFGKIKVGDIADITPQIRGAKTVQAKLVIVDKVIDAASNTFGVRLELPNPNYALPGGIRCDVNFK